VINNINIDSNLRLNNSGLPVYASCRAPS